MKGRPLPFPSRAHDPQRRSQVDNWALLKGTNQTSTLFWLPADWSQQSQTPQCVRSDRTGVLSCLCSLPSQSYLHRLRVPVGRDRVLANVYDSMHDRGLKEISQEPSKTSRLPLLPEFALDRC